MLIKIHFVLVGLTSLLSKVSDYSAFIEMPFLLNRIKRMPFALIRFKNAFRWKTF
ncbi:hypothetical protein EVA_19301 [gut metagenome]|uniref:Uncharacterized protein n=1 Tax=gut metagenome TaxID=749906 RepID=J9FCJ0_9ZZZZ